MPLIVISNLDLASVSVSWAPGVWPKIRIPLIHSDGTKPWKELSPGQGYCSELTSKWLLVEFYLLVWLFPLFWQVFEGCGCSEKPVWGLVKQWADMPGSSARALLVQPVWAHAVQAVWVWPNWLLGMPQRQPWTTVAASTWTHCSWHRPKETRCSLFQPGL